MKVMVIVKATPSSERGEMPSMELLTAMGQYNEELVKAGIMEAGEGLKPSSEAARVHFKGPDRTVTRGPFAETNELIAGYWLWTVDSLDHAIEWVKKCPNPMIEDSDIDIRPLYEMEDFAEIDVDGSASRHEEGLRQTLALKAATVQPYLFFGGRCEVALEFYKHAAGAQVGMLMRHSDSPEPPPEGMLQAGFEHKVMHCDFTIGQTQVLASDGCSEQDGGRFQGFQLAMSVPTAADAQRTFDALAAGGQVVMPLTPTFWSPSFGMLQDKFGVGWMVMVPGEQPQG
ncbi:MAG: YciI family protein [Planctomycetaceae bacterium]